MATESSTPNITLGFVALKNPIVMDANYLKAFLGEFLPAGISVENFKLARNIASFDVGNCHANIAAIDAPIPWSDLQWPSENSWLWTDAVSQLREHRAHLIVTAGGGDEPFLGLNLLLSRIMAAATRIEDAIGVYWGHAPLVLDADTYRQMIGSASEVELPVLAWIAFDFANDGSGRRHVATYGMTYFGLMEIEVSSASRQSGELLDFAISLATMTLTGVVIADGDTIGPDASTKFKVTHADSQWSRSGKVLRLDL